MQSLLRMGLYVVALLIFMGPGSAQMALGTVVRGKVQAPSALISRVAGGNITTLYGIPVGIVDGLGGFSMEQPLVDDLDILFVRDRVSDDAILIGYGHGDTVDISVASTAVCMMLILSPANASLDLNGKLQVVAAMRAHPKFAQLTADVEKSLLKGESPSSPANRDMIALMNEIQNSVPKPQSPSGALQMSDPLFLQN